MLRHFSPWDVPRANRKARSRAPGSRRTLFRSVSLKVMSFNIRYSNTTDQGEKSWSQRRKPCVDMIKDVNPGVIGMQESRTEQRNYLKTMLTKYELLEVPNTGTGSGGNSTVLYRTDLFTRVDWGYFYLSETPGDALRTVGCDQFGSPLLRVGASERQCFGAGVRLPFDALPRIEHLGCGQRGALEVCAAQCE